MYLKRALPQARKHRILHDVTLELTYKCNLECFFCYNDLNKTGKLLSLSQYRTLLEDLARMQTLHLMLTGGEPMVHPHFFEIGQFTRELGFVTRIRTNGHSLSPRNCERIRNEIEPFKVEVSLHGATANVHDRQTRVPGSFERLTKNISHATLAGLNIGVVCTPTKWNEHQVSEMFELCDRLGVPLRFQGPVAPRDDGDLTPLSIQPAETVWVRIQKILESRQAKSQELENPLIPIVDIDSEKEENASCGVGVSGVDIDPFGNVQACMHLQQSAGNLHEQSIEEIWNHSPLFSRARQRAVETMKKFPDIPVKQFGAPVFCLAVEENLNKGYQTGGCGRHK